MTQHQSRSFLLLHGLGGSGPQHWQSWLCQRLRSAGETVHYPVLPDFDAPELDVWMKVLHQEVSRLEGEKIVVCHSLSVLLWLHYARSTPLVPVDRLLLVSPPGPSARPPEVAGFFPAPLDAQALARSTQRVQLVCSDADPYCPERAAVFYGQPLNVPTKLLPPDAGHINVASGYGVWPYAEQWCLQVQS